MSKDVMKRSTHGDVINVPNRTSQSSQSEDEGMTIVLLHIQ